jgi:intracellular septation protein
MATKGIAGIRGIDDEAALPDGPHQRADMPGLRVGRMNFDESRHARIVGARRANARPELRYYPHPHSRARKSRMHILFEFLPLILFLAAYLFKGIYFALGVLMVAMPIGLTVKYMRTGKLDKMYLWSTIFLLVAGAATFYFDNPLFLYWKPTVFYWVVAIAFALSTWIGEKPLVRRAFDVTGDLPTDRISKQQWTALNLVWAAFFVGMGIINIYVAYNFSEKFWATFKVFGLMGLTIVFMIAQGMWLLSKMDLSEDSETTESE